MRARRARPRPPGPPYVRGAEVGELERLTGTLERWCGEILRRHPVIGGDILKLARYARRLLPPRVTARGLSGQLDMFQGGADTQA
jgi:hypothetical protein